jgi:hypothetical protein
MKKLAQRLDFVSLCYRQKHGLENNLYPSVL